MPRLLVSVRSVHEALCAAQAGAHFIDLKDPASGALGGLPPRRIARIVQALRALHPGVPISATIGDVPVASRDEILRRVAAVSSCGVDYVKVGIDLHGRPRGGHGRARGTRSRRCGTAIVPVLIADDGIDDRLVEAALRTRAFPGLMLDTVDKRGGSLLQRRPLTESLAAFVGARARRSGCLAGLAGALRLADLAALRALDPDFAGFRSAVCAGDRAGALDAQRVRALAAKRLAARSRAPAPADLRGRPTGGCIGGAGRRPPSRASRTRSRSSHSTTSIGNDASTSHWAKRASTSAVAASAPAACAGA